MEGQKQKVQRLISNLHDRNVTGSFVGNSRIQGLIAKHELSYFKFEKPRRKGKKPHRVQSYDASETWINSTDSRSGAEYIGDKDVLPFLLKCITDSEKAGNIEVKDVDPNNGQSNSKSSFCAVLSFLLFGVNNMGANKTDLCEIMTAYCASERGQREWFKAASELFKVNVFVVECHTKSPPNEVSPHFEKLFREKKNDVNTQRYLWSRENGRAWRLRSQSHLHKSDSNGATPWLYLGVDNTEHYFALCSSDPELSLPPAPALGTQYRGCYRASTDHSSTLAPGAGDAGGLSSGALALPMAGDGASGAFAPKAVGNNAVEAGGREKEEPPTSEPKTSSSAPAPAASLQGRTAPADASAGTGRAERKRALSPCLGESPSPLPAATKAKPFPPE